MTMARYGFGVLGLALFLSSVAQAQTAPLSAPLDAGGDPQARVGRISVIDGTVSFHTPDQDSWSYATLNYPVVSGNSFWTEPSSRTEIQVGDSALRLDGGTEVDINELDDHGTRVEVTQGTMNIHVGTINPGETYQILTPHEAITLLQPGTYRIHPGSGNDPDEVAVLRGQVQVGDAETMVTVASGESAQIRPGNPPQISVNETTATPFDNWSLMRDNYEEPRQVLNYVSKQMTGYEDLENYGTWQSDPAYGQVWIPAQVPASWAPYHDGHWAYVSPWGWTWIDDAPWGFAPFHYGRWAYVDHHWGWVPGAIAPRPVYAPALVAFLGGSGWGVSIAAGAQPVGWFPLAPNEVYAPGYHVSRDYMRNVNISNVHDEKIINNYYDHPNLQEHFANRNYAAVVAARDFGGGRPVNQVAVHISPQQMAAVPVAPRAAPPASVERHFGAALARPHGGHGPAPVPPQAPAPAAPSRAPQNAQQTMVAPPAAPGPAVQHRNRAPEYMPSMHGASEQRQAEHAAEVPPATPQIQPEAHAAQPMQTAHPQPAEKTHAPVAPVPPMHDQVQAQPLKPRPAPHEAEVQHPVQSAPLSPSHEGWVRQAQGQPQREEAPRPAAPAQQHEQPHNEPHGEALHDKDHPDQPAH